ncbi:MAG: radical SAM protein [Dehalococcoidales bacterium]|nr:MAG: radical SAM protein [Dehalococcoidales bacterium]
MPRDANQNSEGNNTPQDYVFSYELDPESEHHPVYHHRLAELVRVILEHMLNVVTPLKAGEDVKIDGFRWLMDRDNAYQVLPETDSRSRSSKAVFCEPRIDLIKKLAESLLTMVEFEQEGKTVKVDGFRLKNLQDWLVPSVGDPREVFEYTGSHCRCDCVFCCNKGNLPSVAVGNDLGRTAEDEFEEIRTRIKYFPSEAGKALFPRLGCVYEVTEHPYFVDVLYLLREKTSQPFKITTNGCNLSPETVVELARLKPIYLYLSLNSSSALRRQRLMRDPEPETAISALPLLRQQRIPYATVIVPWPVDTVDEMLEDLSSTVAYAARHETHLVQVNLPGYTSHFSSSEIFDLPQLWQAVITRVRELREEHDYPIVTMPTLYEENIYQPRKNLPQILGLVKNSPAYLGGLRRGDVILRINSVLIRDRPQARDILSVLQQSEAKTVNLRVQRERQTLEIGLDLTRYSYPYSRDIDTYLGVIFPGTGLRMSDIESLRETIESHQAKRVLFLSSELMRPTFEQCLAESHLFGDSQLDIDIEVPQNRFFGGNIFMGDLLVVQDFIDCIKDYTKQKGNRPDLAIIPSSPFSLSGWGRDLTGRVYLDIERVTGIPVELLHCATIYE